MGNGYLVHNHHLYDAGLLVYELPDGDEHVEEYLYAVERQSLNYRFRNHFHPYTGELLRRLVTERLPGLQAADTDYVEWQPPADPVPIPTLHDQTFFAGYQPNDALVDPNDHPQKELDFSSGGAYSVYNWELFYHVPLTIGIHLSTAGRHADAQRWLHYVFDPTDDSDGPTPKRFWKVHPFHTIEPRRVEEILINLITNSIQAMTERGYGNMWITAAPEDAAQSTSSMVGTGSGSQPESSETARSATTLIMEYLPAAVSENRSHRTYRGARVRVEPINPALRAPRPRS